jgi:hypothetical protein
LRGDGSKRQPELFGDLNIVLKKSKDGGKSLVCPAKLIVVADSITGG